MRYQIKYGKSSVSFANGRVDLLTWLDLLKDEVITDIRKFYKNNTPKSVLEEYRNYIKNETPTGATVRASGN